MTKGRGFRWLDYVGGSEIAASRSRLYYGRPGNGPVSAIFRLFRVNKLPHWEDALTSYDRLIACVPDCRSFQPFKFPVIQLINNQIKVKIDQGVEPVRALENKYVDDAINVYTLRVFLFAGKRATEERIFCRGKEGEARRRLWKCS
ncbi:hypothetical protein U1Q18_050359, partial [Sarracenia purpurea var. burkii]